MAAILDDLAGGCPKMATILEQVRLRLFQNGRDFGTTSPDVVKYWHPFGDNPIIMLEMEM